MCEIEQSIGSELSDPNAEQHLQAVVEATKEESIGSVVLTATRTSEQLKALDEQAPRSWDLHKSGW